MRKMSCSGKTEWSTSLSCWADSRSRPNGFSMITRAFFAQPDDPSPSTTFSNMLGGMAR